MNKSSRSRHKLLRAMLPLFLFLFGCFTPQPQQPVGPTADEANIAILGEVNRLAPGSQAAFLVQVRAPYTRQRWPNAPVEVYLNDLHGESRQVFSGMTGPDGIAPVSFRVPDTLAAPEQVLEIRSTISPESSNTDEPVYSPYAGEYRTYRDVYVGRTANVLISTDKPVYQPGQVIHLRGLSLDALDLHAADAQTMTVTVADPQGNKLMRRELLTSEYGIVSADFPLDSLAPSGDYTITAALGPTVVERTVEVKPYSLPRFEVTFRPDSPFYLPGETATGTVEARYFFGKPLAEAAVAIVGTVGGGRDGSGARTVVELGGVTDENGVYAFEFVVPDSFRGQLDNKSIDIDLEITVTDTANHPETIDDSVTVAEKPLLVEAVPEAGRLRRGLDDLVYLDVAYPDGTAAPNTALTVTDSFSQTFAAVTDAYGQAVITLTTPSDGLTPVVVSADDGRGRTVEQPLLLPSEDGASQVALLLRPSQAEYRIGDTLDVDILVAGAAETVYLDIIKDRQTFGLAPLPVTDGVAQAAIEIDGSLLGTLELNAYAVDAAGQLASDRRYVLVNPPPAEVSITADKEQYRPGETATLALEVTREGQPLEAAVGIAIVDESVYAIEDVDSRFARTYFLLNRELQESRYGLHEFVDLDSDAPSPYDGSPDSIEYAYNGGPGRAELAAVAGAQSRQIALTGAFAQILAEEAAAQADAEAVATGGASAPPATAAPQPLYPWALASAWGNRLYLLAPMVGIALYDGTRNRRRLLIGLVVFSLGAFVWGACAAPAGAPAAPAEPQLEGSTASDQGQKPPRLRQFFPETMYWMPELLTDEDGRAQIEVPVADSITTWRASLLVSDKEGNLGSSELGLRVFQDFFVEPDLPRFLTVGDEIDVPIAVYNYLPEPQTIALSVVPADWFELRGDPVLSFAAGPNEVMAAYLPIRVTEFGLHELQIVAGGKGMADAVQRTVEVLPDGQAAAEVSGGRLEGSTQITLPLPTTAIEGTGRVTVKVYGGAVSQVLAGLEGMLQMPYGCFEQTSSATYPNVLVLDYLRRTGQANGRLELQAQHLVGLGYQRLLGFEVDGEPGGFSLYGDPPADPMLTAYGVQEFGDMARVAYVDPELLARMVDFLAERQNRDGSWEPRWADMGEAAGRDNKLAATAYVAWGLADAGYGDDRSVRRAVRYLERSLERSSTGGEQSAISTYTLALMANALIAAGEDASPAVKQLAAQAQRADGGAFWTPGTQTYLGSYGLAGDIETTALAAQALLRSGADPDLAQAALDYLARNRDANGSFYTTQATIQALKALLLAADSSQEQGAAAVSVTLSGQDSGIQRETITVDDANADLLQSAVFSEVPPGAALALEVQGERPLHYQIITEYYLPWEAATAAAFVPAPMRIAVTYDRSKAQVNETVGVRADVELLTPQGADTLIVDLGLPPGFVPLTEELDALIENGEVQRYELRDRSIILYLSGVQSGRVYNFEYRLLARAPASVQAPPSQVYDYYAPDQRAVEGPQRITVELGTP